MLQARQQLVIANHYETFPGTELSMKKTSPSVGMLQDLMVEVRSSICLFVYQFNLLKTISVSFKASL